MAPAAIRLGERIALSFTLTSSSGAPQRPVIDYAIRYARKRRATSRKVFKLKEVDLVPGESRQITHRQTIRLAEGAFELLG